MQTHGPYKSSPSCKNKFTVEFICYHILWMNIVILYYAIENLFIETGKLSTLKKMG